VRKNESLLQKSEKRKRVVEENDEAVVTGGERGKKEVQTKSMAMVIYVVTYEFV
jgi:hypothetical protein